MVVVLAGCSGPVELAAPHPSDRAAAICRDLVPALPDTVDGQPKRDVTPASPYTAAWGDPPITLACGVAKPAGLNAASRCAEVNGVGWYPEQRADDYRFTTIGRRTYVQVTVPNAYAPQANPLVDLAAAIHDHVPVIKNCV